MERRPGTVHRFFVVGGHRLFLFGILAAKVFYLLNKNMGITRKITRIAAKTRRVKITLNLWFICLTPKLPFNNKDLSHILLSSLAYNNSAFSKDIES
jgi:hypothetical protein